MKDPLIEDLKKIYYEFQELMPHRNLEAEDIRKLDEKIRSYIGHKSINHVYTALLNCQYVKGVPQLKDATEALREYYKKLDKLTDK